MTAHARRPIHGRLGRLLLVGFVVLTLIKVWVGPLNWPPRAEAQIPNAGDQRLALVREVQRTNRLLSEVLMAMRGLQKQTFRVKLTEPRPKPVMIPRTTGQ